MINRKFVDWHNIFIDTSVVISYLRSLRDDKVEVCNFVGKLIKQLVAQKSSSNKPRNFFISTITIAEILQKPGSDVKASKIVKALDSDNVTFYPFDTDIAEFMAKSYRPYLNEKTLTSLAREFSWPEHELNLGRQWIEKDLMILATCQYLQCDTILTIDTNTMVPMAEKIGIYSTTCLIEHFEFSGNGKTIYNYNKPKHVKSKPVVKSAKKTKE